MGGTDTENHEESEHRGKRYRACGKKKRNDISTSYPFLNMFKMYPPSGKPGRFLECVWVGSTQKSTRHPKIELNCTEYVEK